MYQFFGNNLELKSSRREAWGRDGNVLRNVNINAGLQLQSNVKNHQSHAAEE